MVIDLGAMMGIVKWRFFAGAFDIAVPVSATCLNTPIARQQVASVRCRSTSTDQCVNSNPDRYHAIRSCA